MNWVTCVCRRLFQAVPNIHVNHRWKAKRCMRAFVLASVFSIPPASWSAGTVEFSRAPSHQSSIISAPVRFLADSQLHELYGAPTYSQSAMIDQLVEVAVRPSQQRLFAESMLIDALTAGTSANEAKFFVHLGDAVDVSCTSEWRRFIDTINSSGRSFVLAPGNHDGYYLGNLLPPSAGETSNFRSDEYGAKGWQLRCGPVDPLLKKESALSKPDLIKTYVGHVLPDAPVVWEGCGKNFQCFMASSGHGTLRRVRAKLSEREKRRRDGRAPWRSFLIQEVDLSRQDCLVNGAPCQPVRLILLDTSQYGQRPRLPVSSAGRVGSLLPDQLEIARTWGDEITQDRGIALFAGHHPLASITATARNAILDLICKQQAPVYISAHTHTGYWRRWNCQNGRTLVELNIGSVLDDPIHARRLTVSVSESVLSLTAELIFPIDEGLCRNSWIPAHESGRSPEEQKLEPRTIASPTKEGRRALLSALSKDLLEYRALFQHFPAIESASVPGPIPNDRIAISRIDDMLARIEAIRNPGSGDRVPPARLLGDLREYELKRIIHDPTEVRRYKSCLGAWAARMDRERQQKHASRESDSHQRSNWMDQTVTFRF